MKLINITYLRKQIENKITDLIYSSYKYQIGCNYEKNRKIQDQVRDLEKILETDNNLIKYFYPSLK